MVRFKEALFRRPAAVEDKGVEGFETDGKMICLVEGQRSGMLEGGERGGEGEDRKSDVLDSSFEEKSPPVDEPSGSVEETVSTNDRDLLMSDDLMSPLL